MLCEDSDKETAFSDACLYEHFEVAKYLIQRILEKHGKDKMEEVLNKADKNDRTTLFDATLRGNVQFVQYLLNIKETDVNVPGDDGMSPLHIASERGHLKIVKAYFF